MFRFEENNSLTSVYDDEGIFVAYIYEESNTQYRVMFPNGENDRVSSRTSAVELIEMTVMDEENRYNEPYYSDYSDDAEALASAGFGTDEDYGVFGEN